jgi:hypothetical protein
MVLLRRLPPALFGIFQTQRPTLPRRLFVPRSLVRPRVAEQLSRRPAPRALVVRVATLMTRANRCPARGMRGEAEKATATSLI